MTKPLKSYQEQYFCCSLDSALSKLSISGMSMHIKLNVQDTAAVISHQSRLLVSLTHGRANTGLKAVCPLQMFSSGPKRKA